MPTSSKTTTESKTEQVFEQTEDAHGRVRLDRPFTPQEAQEQDAANRELFEQERRAKWSARKPR